MKSTLLVVKLDIQSSKINIFQGWAENEIVPTFQIGIETIKVRNLYVVLIR